MPIGRSSAGSIHWENEANGKEWFGRMTPHSETDGIYGTRGTVGDFLDQQGVAPYFEIIALYRAVYDRMVDCLENLDPTALERRQDRQNDIEETEAGLTASSWIDVDKTVAEFCEARKRPIPESADIQGAVVLHIEAIDAWIASL
jgi:hypothetical protein